MGDPGGVFGGPGEGLGAYQKALGEGGRGGFRNWGIQRVSGRTGLGGGRRVSEEPGGCLGALSRGLEVTGVAPGSPGEG